MALSYDERIQIEMNRIKELKRKQKLEKARINAELDRMLTERFPGITPDTFEKFISLKVKKNILKELL